MQCDTLHVVPGAVLGGSDTSLSEISDVDPAEEQVVRAQIAHDVAADATERGLNGAIIRAMIDPRETIAAWVGADGEVVVGVQAPSSVASADVIFVDGADSVLVLDADQAMRMGIPSLEGPIADLGALLGFDDWQMESGYGRKMMARAVNRHRRREDHAHAKYEADVKRNMQRRDTARRSLEGNLASSEQWDPNKGVYSDRYKRGYGWGGWRRVRSSGWTSDSRNEWVRRTDTCLGYLNNAAAAARALHKLDRGAAELGLEPSYKPGELETIMRDIQTKASNLEANRNRQG